VIDSWLARPWAGVVHPGERQLAVMKALLDPMGSAGNLTSDAHLAAVSIEHGAELCSCDSDFSRFLGVRWVNPLA
jgi:predicted nucleic acid-binding protein